MYSSHVFDPDYLEGTDDSPIVCVGSFTEGPNRPPKPTARVMVSDSLFGDIVWPKLELNFQPWLQQMTSEILYGTASWTVTLKGPPVYTFQQGQSGAEWTTANPSYGNGHKALWTIYDEAWNVLGPIVGGKPSKKCTKHDTVIEFGPKNWINKEPCKYPSKYWQLAYMPEVPPVGSPCWKEPVQLPSFPEPDWKALADEINSNQYSYTKFVQPGFAKLLGAAC